MDPLTSIITAIALNYFTHFTADKVQAFFKKAFELNPELEERLRAVNSVHDIEAIFNEAVGIIDANAGTGTLNIDTGLLEAVRGIRFNHANGTVTIANTTIKAPVIQTGGAGVGKTKITDTQLKTKGTSISVGKGASIVMTGGAKITQS